MVAQKVNKEAFREKASVAVRVNLPAELHQLYEEIENLN